MKYTNIFLMVSIFVTALSASASELTSAQVRLDGAGCANRLERASDTSFECRIPIVIDGETVGLVVHGEERTMHFGSCRVDLRATDRDYRLTLSKDTAKRPHFARNEAELCLQQAVEIGDLGRLTKVLVH